MAEELTPEERREWARWLYTKDDMSNKDIALMVGTDEATIRRWAQENAWGGSKRSLLTSKKSQLEFLYDALEKMREKAKNTDDVNTRDIDKALKYTAAIKNLQIEASVSEIIEVFELFILWLRRRDVRLAQKVVVYLDAFVKEREEA